MKLTRKREALAAKHDRASETLLTLVEKAISRSCNADALVRSSCHRRFVSYMPQDLQPSQKIVATQPANTSNTIASQQRDILRASRLAILAVLTSNSVNRGVDRPSITCCVTLAGIYLFTG